MTKQPSPHHNLRPVIEYLDPTHRHPAPPGDHATRRVTWHVRHPESDIPNIIVVECDQGDPDSLCSVWAGRQGMNQDEMTVGTAQTTDELGFKEGLRLFVVARNEQR